MLLVTVSQSAPLASCGSVLPLGFPSSYRLSFWCPAHYRRGDKKTGAPASSGLVLKASRMEPEWTVRPSGGVQAVQADRHHSRKCSRRRKQHSSVVPSSSFYSATISEEIDFASILTLDHNSLQDLSQKEQRSSFSAHPSARNTWCFYFSGLYPAGCCWSVAMATATSWFQ